MKVADDAKFYEWEGKRIGSGNMRITAEHPDSVIEYDLTFLTPWKSTAKVRFELESLGDTTRAVWLMESSLPFFMFWMKKTMETLIGMDFERGLNMLKEYVEDGAIKSKLEFIGKGSYPGCQYIGISTSGAIADVGKFMTNDFEKLWNYLGKNKDNIAGESFSIYHKWEMVKQKVSYTAGIPLQKVPDNLPEGMIAGAIPSIATPMVAVASKDVSFIVLLAGTAFLGDKILLKQQELLARAIGNALKEGGNKNVIIKELPNMNHLFQVSETGTMSEYATIEQTFAPLVLQEVSGWKLKQVSE